MPLRVLIMPDKFKGTLTARDAAMAIRRGWRQARPQDRLECLPMSDGGDGFGETLGRLLGAKPQVARTVDAARRPCRARWWWQARSRTALVESARVIGLAMLPPGRFHPFELDTFGLGQMLRAAIRRGGRQGVIGIGGSATNDGGFGLGRALGWRFTDPQGRVLERWTDLERLAHLEPPAAPLPAGLDLTVAVDVQNPLLGRQGATRIYGPQKGIRPADIARAEACLGRLASVLHQETGLDCAALPGAGAAGGLGFGLVAFAGARLQPGFALFAARAQLEQRLAAADVVVTGEGAMDGSTLMGKGVGELGRCCQRRNIPCLGLAGVARERPRLEQVLTAVHALAPDLTSPEQAVTQPRYWLARLATRVARGWAAT
jgi:glycerate kinase